MTAATTGLQIIDDALDNPEGYRQAALKRDYRSYDFGHCVFHGIATLNELSMELRGIFHEVNPALQPVLSFFRKSPLGQVEPHFIHTDIDMGDWSALLYLNPEEPTGDGTDFWTYKPTGVIESSIPHERSKEGLMPDPALWKLRQHVQGSFNRLLIFPSSYFHSRTIFENWGEGNDARLVQVVFGNGQL